MKVSRTFYNAPVRKLASRTDLKSVEWEFDSPQAYFGVPVKDSNLINKYMHYTVYKVTNQINGKVYIGCHKTNDLNDGYMGSGKYLKRAIEKNGLENFTKEILFDYDTSEEMFAKEKELVTLDFISEENTYNLKVGGYGGWDHIDVDVLKKYRHDNAKSGRRAQQWLWQNDPGWKESHRLKLSNGQIKRHLENPESTKNFLNYWQGRKHTEETKLKISTKNSILQLGKRNSQYGTMWINNGLKNTKLKNGLDMPEGWSKGRLGNL